MFLSIIIPIWNDEKYLEECLDSCLHQDISYDDYEIICVDDGSTDRTPEILRDYAERYPNIRIITKQHGTAYGYGRNIGYEAATGDFLWLVDHDDIIAPNVLGELKSAAQDPENYDRIAFPYYRFDTQMTGTEKERLAKGTLIPNDGDVFLQMALWSGIIRASFFRKHGIWPHSKRNEAAGEFWNIKDFDAWGGDNVCMEECFDNGMRTKQLSGRPIYHYRRHSASETMNTSCEWLAKKEKQKLQAALLRGYLAAKLKERYLAEREDHGKATVETTVAMIMKLRRSVAILNGLPRKTWAKGIEMLRSREVFLPHKPEEYSFSLRDFYKTRTLMEKISPQTYTFYYSYTLAGARWLRALSIFTRLRGISPMIISLYRKNKKRLFIKRGMGG